MDKLPLELCVDVCRRVGEYGFRYLGPFIAASRQWRNAVFSRPVLQSVELSEFKVQTDMVNMGSSYRPFFRACVYAGNITATELEGLRMLCQEGPSETAFAMVNMGGPESVFGLFVTGIFCICAGQFDRGMASLIDIWEYVETWEEAVQLADTIVAQIVTMGPAGVGLYRHTHYYPTDNVPDCTFINCEATNVCECCFPYWYSLIVCSIC